MKQTTESSVPDGRNLPRDTREQRSIEKDPRINSERNITKVNDALVLLTEDEKESVTYEAALNDVEKALDKLISFLRTKDDLTGINDPLVQKLWNDVCNPLVWGDKAKRGSVLPEQVRKGISSITNGDRTYSFEYTTMRRTLKLIEYRGEEKVATCTTYGREELPLQNDDQNFGLFSKLRELEKNPSAIAVPNISLQQWNGKFSVRIPFHMKSKNFDALIRATSRLEKGKSIHEQPYRDVTLWQAHDLLSLLDGGAHNREYFKHLEDEAKSIDESVDKICQRHPKLLQDIRMLSGQSERKSLNSLGPKLLELATLVEKECNFLHHDRPGFHGNNLLQLYLVTHKANERECFDEAGVFKKILQRVKANGFLEATFSYRERGTSYKDDSLTVSLPGHVALNVRTKAGMMIVDTWMSEPGKEGVFFVGDSDLATKHLWRKHFEAFEKKEKEEKAALLDYRIKTDGGVATDKAFAASWNNHFFTDNRNNNDGETDFHFFLDFATSGSPHREFIRPWFFQYMRDKIAHFIGTEKTKPVILSCENTPEGWKKLQPFINEYFRTVYANSPAVKEKFKE